MTERVLDRAHPVAVELVLDGLEELGSLGDGGLHRRVHVADVEHDAHGRAAECSRRPRPHFRGLVGQHDHRVADIDLGVSGLAVGPRHAHLLGRAEDALVEVERARGAVDDQVRRDVVIALRNYFDLAAFAHHSPPSVILRPGDKPPRAWYLDPVIIHLNYLPKAGETGAGDVLAALFSLIDQRRLDPDVLPHLRLHLDWIQYKANFREPVTVRHAADARGERMALAELAVDLRRTSREHVVDDLASALASMGTAASGSAAASSRAGSPDHGDRVVVDDWVPLGDSSIWQFNRLFWQRLADWERQSGRGFEAALPSGRSDANDPAAGADAGAAFWTLLVELGKRGQLPAESFALQIRVGSGARAHPSP